MLWNDVGYKNSNEDFNASPITFFFKFFFPFCLDIFIFCLLLPASKKVKEYVATSR